MKKMLIVLSLYYFSAFVAKAEDSTTFFGQDYKSVEWQAIKLQERIESKIKTTLKPIISDAEYIVEAKVSIDLAKAEDPTPKKKTKTVKAKKTAYSNVPFPEDGEEFIVFNKLGLEAPIVGDEPIVSEVSEAELNQKAIIELNERFNLFNFLESITVNISFDKSVPEKTRLSISQALDTISLYTRDVVPQFNVQYVELNNKTKNEIKDIEKKYEEEKQRLLDQITSKDKIIEERKNDKKVDQVRFRNLDIMIGLIAAALLIVVGAVYVNHNGSKVESDLLSKNENNDKVDQNLTEEGPQTGEEDMIDLTKEDAITFKIKANLERFKTVFEHNKPEIILMVKSWIKEADKDQVGALNALVQVLPDADLAEIFKLLMIEERDSWKQVLVDDEFTKEEIAKHFTFVGNEIVKTMMVPPVVDDYELCTLLLTVTAEDAALYCEQYPDLAGVFANVLSSKTVSAMFKLLSEDVALDLIENSKMVTKSFINEKVPQLKGLLVKAKESKERPPFLKGIIDILPSAKPEVEMKLYTTLLTYLTVDEAVPVALKVLPYDLIEELDSDVFSMLMEDVAKEKQIYYLASLSENAREEMLEKFAAEGTKVRELLNLELETVLIDEIAMQQLKGNRKHEVKADFFNAIRKVVTEKNDVKMHLTDSVKSWLEKVKMQVKRTEKTLAA